MIHTAIRTKFVLLWMLLLSFLPLSVSAQEQVIEINMSNGAWHDWNNNPSNPYARSWFSTTHPQISICCIEGGTKTTDIRGKAITGANNISVHNGNYLSFYSAYGSYSDGEYEITVADGWHIKTVEFDFESSVDNNISVVLNGQAEVVSSSPGNIGHVSTTISNDDTYSVPFTVKKEMENGFAQTGNFYITVARDAGLMESYAALLIEAKTQLLGALKLANAVINVNSSQNLITSATQFSSPYTETLEGSTEALLDGNSTTFWHSKWADGSVPNHTHYLQVDLIEPTYNDIALTFTRRSNAINDHITLWSVYGSNNPYAAVEDWEFLSYLYTPYTSNTETITSLPFGVGGYQYLRFYIDGTTTGRGYGHMSEFQLNPASLEVDPNVSYLGKAIQLGLVVGQHNLINQNDIGWTEYNTLLAAHNALLAKFVYAFEVDNMYFKTNSLTERTAAISYRGNLYNTYADEYTGDVVIPESVIFSGYTYGITTIDEYAFAACSGLTSITIPNTITAIGNGAFYGCTSLTSVTVNQDTPLPITANTFTNCTNVTLHVPAGSKAAYQTAPYWQDFKEIVETGTDGSPIIVFADANVKAICVAYWDANGDGELSYSEAAAVTGLGFFEENHNITSFNELQYFTGLTSIGDYIFYNCNSLTEVIIPNSVTSIGYYTFHNCNSLTEVIIPNSVTSIGAGAFSGCSGLTSVTIPNSVTSIGENAFRNCSTLPSITIPSSVTNIGDGAFYGCSSLTAVTVDIETPLTINSNAFTNRANATLYVPMGSKAAYEAAPYWQDFKEIIETGTDGSPIIVFADANVKAICVANWDTNGDGELSEAEAAAVTDIGLTFQGQGISSFNEFSFFTGLTSIPDEAFYECYDLTSIIFPNGVTTIGRNLLQYTDIDYIYFPSSVTKIGRGTHGIGSGNLSHIEFASIESLCNIDFEDSSANPLAYKTSSYLYINGEKVTDVVIPDGVTSIGNYAFTGYHNLNSVTISNSVMTIGTEAFSRSGLKSVTLGNSVTTIGNSAFFRCNIAELDLPNSVTEIGSSAFSGCTGLTELNLPNSVTEIGSSAFGGCTGLIEISIPSNVGIIGDNPFAFCNNITSITVDNENTKYDSREGCNAIINTETNTLVSGCVNTIIPNSVTAIGNAAFGGCSNLTEITIPTSVTTIGNSSFTGCSNLTGIDLPNSIITIGDIAFGSCDMITTITIPNSVTTIGWALFNGCPNLKEVTFGSGLTSIGIETFFCSDNLEVVRVYATVPPAAENDGYSHSAILYVPAGTKTAYEAANFWKTFSTIIEMEADSSPIIVFADANVKAICVANWDINGDGELSEAEAAAVTDLGEVFTGNEDIHTFHELSYFTGLTAIGDSAFANCGLQEVTIPANVTLIDKTAFKACGLTTITIPSGVTSIGASAFYGCTSLASVTIPESVTTIGMSAFSHCSSLPAITIPEGVTTIGMSAFSYCSSLTYVSIPSTVTRLNDFTFMGCNNITTVRSYIKSPSVSLLLGPLTFTSTTRNNATLYVPKGSKATYESQLWWQNFKHIVEMGGDVNDDGEITLADKVALINWLLLQDDDDAYDPLYDVNDDGVVDVRDALRILELIANPW